jgi:hypothetical protein
MADKNASEDEKMGSYRDWVIRCPRLGGEVRFSYCEREAGHLPCRQVIRCWESGFPVEKYLRETLMPEDWERFCKEIPRDRMTTILDIALAVKGQRQR